METSKIQPEQTPTSEQDLALTLLVELLAYVNEIPTLSPELATDHY